jgi:dehydrogenase/reductase SDR family member 7B
MDADTCARKILDAILKRKKEVYIGGKETLMVYFRRYAPALFNALIRKQSPY